MTANARGLGWAETGSPGVDPMAPEPSALSPTLPVSPTLLMATTSIPNPEPSAPSPPPEPARQAGGGRLANLPPSRLPEDWRIRLPDFEGPLDLLLHLIKLNKVEIIDIPVAPICDQFHHYLELMEELDLDIAAEYIYMAAYLIHLKSKMLLPKPRDLEGKEIDEDPRQDLVERLLEYRRIKEAAQTFAEVDSMRRGMWPRHSDEIKRITKDDTPEIDISDLSLFDLLRTFKTVLERYEREHPDPMVMVGETFSIRDQIVRLLDRLSSGRAVDLVDDLRTLSGRREAIAAFLAILEMAKLQLIRLHRGRGSLLIYRTERQIGAQELEAVGP